MPFASTRPASQASLATVRRLIKREIFKYLSRSHFFISSPCAKGCKKRTRNTPGPPTRRMLLLVVDSVLQCLASLEGRGLGSGNLDLLVGAGIPAGAGAALADLEGAKAHQLDLVALLQGLRNGVDDSGNSRLSVLS